MGLNGEYDKIGNIIAKEILDVKKEITPANIDSNLSLLGINLAANKLVEFTNNNSIDLAITQLKEDRK